MLPYILYIFENIFIYMYTSLVFGKYNAHYVEKIVFF